MAVASSTLSPLGRADGLAVNPAGMVRSVAMSVDTEAKLLRAKNRLYVLCQLVGWGGLTVINLFYLTVIKEPASASAREPLVDNAVFVMIMLQGLLVSHYLRPLIAHWGWKELGWAALLPRVVGISLAASLLWSAVGYGYVYGVLRYPWESKLSFGPALLVTTINGALVLGGWLCIYFIYHTFERLRRLQLEQLRLAASVKEAELRALKSQVNPHFLFNSLNSLRALIDEDAPKARESVTRLANMLRYSLQSGQLETVPFEDELRIVEDYLALEQVRHEDRLRVKMDIAVGTRTVPMPPMLLQTLVENAVKYGISTRREGGELGITARIAGGALDIRVTNPGDLAAPASAAAARAGSSTGVGLRNASDRLKLVFGEHAHLTLLAEPAGCVTARVLIPLNYPGK